MTGISWPRGLSYHSGIDPVFSSPLFVLNRACPTLPEAPPTLWMLSLLAPALCLPGDIVSEWHPRAGIGESWWECLSFLSRRMVWKDALCHGPVVYSHTTQLILFPKILHLPSSSLSPTLLSSLSSFPDSPQILTPGSSLILAPLFVQLFPHPSLPLTPLPHTSSSCL